MVEEVIKEIDSGEALSKEIDEMLGDMVEDPKPDIPPEKEEQEQVSKKEPEKEEEEKPSEEEEEEKSPEELQEKEPSEKEPPKEEEPSKEDETVEELQLRIKKLTERVEELTPSQFEKTVPKEPSKKEPIKEEVPKEKPPIKTPAEEINFLGEDSVDDLIDDREKFNGVLNSVLAKAVEVTEGAVFEKVLLSIPEIVTGHISRQAVVGKLVGDFYDVNKDLIPVKRTVGAVANNLHAEHPDWKVEKVFKEAAIKTREVLGLKDLTKKAGGSKLIGDPAFVNAGGGKPPAKEIRGTLQDEIDDFINP